MPPEVSDTQDRHANTGMSELVVLDSNLVMKGELNLSPESDLVILGKVDCTVIRGVRKLSIGVQGAVSGDVQSVTAEIAGALNGRADIAEAVLLKRTARVRGEVSARWVNVEEGTNLEGCVLSGKIRRAEAQTE